MAELLSTLLASVGTFLTSLLGWFGELASLVSENAVVFVFLFAVPLVSFAISVLLRLIGRRRRGRG